MVGHVLYWIVSTALAGVCLWQALRVGRGGLDDAGTVTDWLQYNRTKIWAALAVGLIFLPLLDIFLFFNPPPPDMR